MKTIEPFVQPLIVKGKLFYDESLRAYTKIRLKRRVLDEFAQLREERGWNYQIEFHGSCVATMKRIQDAQHKEEGIPLLLFIYPTKDGQTN